MQAIKLIFEQGGLFMYINIGVLTISLAVIIERAISLFFRQQVNAPALLEQIRKLVGANNVTRAVKLCSASSAPVAKVAKAGLTHFHKGGVAISTAIEETLVDVTPELKKRISSLWSLANIATLIGLIGTIRGLIITFAGAGTANPAEKAKMLTDGIAEAMYNTAFGLIIAVLCMIGHVILSGMSRKHQSDLDAFALKLENSLTEESRKWEHQQGGAGAEGQR